MIAKGRAVIKVKARRTLSFRKIGLAPRFLPGLSLRRLKLARIDGAVQLYCGLGFLDLREYFIAFWAWSDQFGALSHRMDECRKAIT
jgi:hypothetical protein